MKKIYILIFVFSMLFLTAFGDVGVPVCRPGESPYTDFCSGNNLLLPNDIEELFYFVIMIVFVIFSLLALFVIKKKNKK